MSDKDSQNQDAGIGWIEFQLWGPLPALEAFSDFMTELGAAGAVFSEAPDRPGGEMVTAFLPLAEERPGLLERIKARVSALAREFPGEWGELAMARVEDRNWDEEWKNTLEPIRLPPGLWIVPSFKPAPPEAKAEPIIRLDPGLAFGTGAHATTQMCVKAVAEAVKAGARSVLDLGTGTGILAMVAALLGAESILAVDLDPLALQSCRENLKANGLADRVEVRQGVGDPETVLPDPPFDLIAANLFAETLVNLMPFIARHLGPGGVAVLSGILEEREELVKRAVEEAHLTIERRLKEEEWVTLITKPGESAR